MLDVGELAIKPVEHLPADLVLGVGLQRLDPGSEHEKSCLWTHQRLARHMAGQETYKSPIDSLVVLELVLTIPSHAMQGL